MVLPGMTHDQVPVLLASSLEDAGLLLGFIHQCALLAIEWEKEDFNAFSVVSGAAFVQMSLHIDAAWA